MVQCHRESKARTCRKRSLAFYRRIAEAYHVDLFELWKSQTGMVGESIFQGSADDRDVWSS